MTKLDENYMNLAYGVGWRGKVMAEWHRLPWWKRAYWTMRGKHPRKAVA